MDSRAGTHSTRTTRSIEVSLSPGFPGGTNQPLFFSFLSFGSRPSIYTRLDRRCSLRLQVFLYFLFISFIWKNIYEDCGSNLSVPGAASGVFTSPKYPEKYDRSSGLLSCSWQIHSARDHRILLHFESFSIEGEMESKFLSLSFSFFSFFLHLFYWFFAARGCAAAAVRVWKRLDEPPVEICGENLKAEHETFMSEGNVMKIT